VRTPPTFSLVRFVLRFVRAERGATAVEFALVSLPFFTLIFGIVELAMILLVYTSLEQATETAGRLIRTGEFQQGSQTTKGDFKNLVCARMTWLASSCSGSLWVDVQTFSSFAGLAANAQQPPTSFDPNATCFTPGAPTDIVLVRTYYQWKLFTPLLDGVMANMGTGDMRQISSATAFRNEPYSDVPPVGAKCN
jgi:Flp pilus assembly protein TadG